MGYREEVWTKHIATISSHNDEYDLGVHSFKLGENIFSDLTSDEFVSFFNGYKPEDNVKADNVFSSDLRLWDLPAAVNWTDKGYVTAVKDQKQCGSCWAFSATGSLEGQWFKKYNKSVSLSEQNLVDCSAKQGNHGCMGGIMDNAFKYIKLNGGIDTEASYPYTAKTGKVCLYNATNKGANLTSWTDIPMGSEIDLQKAVVAWDPFPSRSTRTCRPSSTTRPGCTTTTSAPTDTSTTACSRSDTELSSIRWRMENQRISGL